MKNKLVLLMAFTAVIAVSCEKSDADRFKNIEIHDLTQICGRLPEKIIITESEQKIRDDITSFAYKLYSQIYEDGKDISISPFSISIALSMLTTGASGNTEAELLKVLGGEGRTTADLHSYYSKVMGMIAYQDPSTTLSIANAIWANEDIIPKTQFIKDCENWFSSTLKSVDFSDGATVEQMNDWGSEHTNSKIDRMFDGIPPVTNMVLSNTIYFKAAWPFEFVRSGDRLLAKVCTYYMENDRCSLVRLPYGNGAFLMDIIIPSANTSIKEVVDDFDSLIYNSFWEIANVSLDMPVFSFSYSPEELSGALIKMGIRDAFDIKNADFSKMNDTPLCVDNVVHKTFVEVNEKSTKPDYLTGHWAEHLTGQRDINFTVDRDFLFEITDRTTYAVIFIGQHKM